MRKHFTIYDKTSGEILRYGSCSEKAYKMLSFDADREAILPVASKGRIQYVLNGGVVDRPIQNTVADKDEVAADGSSPVTLSLLPSSCEVCIEDERYYPDGSVFGITFDAVGDYYITIKAFPYMEKEIKVGAI